MNTLHVHWKLKFIVIPVMFICCIYIINPNTSILSKLVDGMATNSRQKTTQNSPCMGYGTNATNSLNVSCSQRLPTCLIIGVEKAGTYALLKFLSVHPQIVRNISYNELYFFDRFYHKGLDWYKDKMPFSYPGQSVIEKTPTYFFRREVPARVFRMNPNIRLLLIVRNPVQRSISAYVMSKEMHHGYMKDFEKFVIRPSGAFEASSRFIQHSLYDYYLENWLKFFKLEQIHIVDGDLFSRHPVHELRKIEEFLNVDHYFTDDMFVFNSTKGFYCLKVSHGFQTETTRTNDIDCLKYTKGRKHPNVDSSIIKKMKNFFRPHNMKFYNMTGKYFNWETCM